MTFLVHLAIVLAQIILGFYGFWLVWRVLLPVLPGPEKDSDRMAPYAGYFTDPVIRRAAERIQVHPRWIAAGALVIIAAAQVALQRAIAGL